MKRLLAVIASLSLCVPLLILPVSAVEVSGDNIVVNGEWSMETWGNDGSQTSNGSDFTFLGLPRSGEWSLTVDSATLNPTPLLDNWLGMDRLYPEPTHIGRLTGTVGFYTSYYFIAQSGVTQWNYMERPFTFYYEDSYGISHYDEVIPEVFEPTATVSTGLTPGVLIKAKTNVEDGDSIYNLQLRSTGYQFNGTKGDSYSNYRIWVYIPSMSIVTTETSAELEGLENIADSITAGNDILSAMYGDIMSILNKMYARMGDMLAVEEAMRDYLSNIDTWTQDIDLAVWEIHNLLGSEFDRLISTIETEGSDIEIAIIDSTDRLIALFTEGGAPDDYITDKDEQLDHGQEVFEGLGQLEKPDVDTLNPDVSGGLTGDGAAGYTDLLGAVFEFDLIVQLMLVSLSIVFLGYVLYGKRT